MTSGGTGKTPAPPLATLEGANQPRERMLCQKSPQPIS
jgi:hypothetical protein